MIHSEKEHHAQIIIDLKDPANIKTAIQSMKQILTKYFDKFGAKKVYYYFDIGELDETGTFQKGSNSNNFFHYVVIEFPQLIPEVEAFVKHVDKSMSACHVMHVGVEPVCALAKIDRRYFPLFKSIFSYVDFDHSVGEDEYYINVIGSYEVDKEIIDLVTEYNSSIAIDIFAYDALKDKALLDYYLIKLVEQCSYYYADFGKKPIEDFDENYDLDMIEFESMTEFIGYHCDIADLFPDIEPDTVYERMDKALEQAYFPTHKYITTGNF